MRTTIRRLGNSAGVILPAAMMKSLNLETGQDVNISEEKGSIIITPASKQNDLDTIKAMNLAINYALDVAKDKGEQFLRLWRAGKLDVIKKEFPDFKGYLGE